MFRSVASGVSALSGSVANGHQTLHYVSSSPSKIPYGGFSPVRLQTELSNRDLRLRAHTRRLIRGQSSRRSTPVALAGKLPDGSRRGVCTEPFGPEALGSPAGYAVRPGPRLLWPHPRLWLPPGGLSASSGGLLGGQRVPTFICLSLIPCRRPYPGGSDGGAAVPFPPVGAFVVVRRSRHPLSGQVGLTPGSYNEAAPFALCCGPESCSPCTDQGFYIRAFIP